MARDSREQKENSREFARFVERIETLVEEKNWEEIGRELEAHRRAYADFAEFHYFWGRYLAHLDEGDPIKHFLKAIEIDPGDSRFYEAAARVYRQRDKTDEAIAILRRGTSQARDAAQLYLLLEDYAFDNEDYDLLEEIVKEFRERHGDSGPFLYRTAQSYYRAGLIASCLDTLRQCTDINHFGEFHYHYLALSCEYYQSAYDLSHRTLVFYRKQLRRTPEDRDLHMQLHAFVVAQPQLVAEKVRLALFHISGGFARIYGRLHDTRYLMSDEEAKRIFTEWESQELPGLEFDYEFFGEIYLYLARNADRYPGIEFDLIERIRHISAKLKELGQTTPAMVFDGWVEFLDGNINEADKIFSQVLERPDNEDMSGNLRALLSEGRACVDDQLELRLPGSEISGKGESLDDSRLLTYGSNVYKTAKNDLIVGLDPLVRRMVDIIGKGTIKSIILTGPSGVGKTAAIKGLARFLQKRACPGHLRGSRIFQISTTSLLSGAKYIGMWQDRLKTICEAGSFKRKVILYFEDIANIFGAGKTEGSEARFADYLIPRMEQGEIVLIGEMDTEQAQTILWVEPRFRRLVNLIPVEEPEQDKAFDIVKAVADRDGESRGVVFEPESIREAIDLTTAFMPYRALPGKAIDVIRQAAEIFGDGKRGQPVHITQEEIVLTFCEITGIPDLIVDNNQVVNIDRMRQFFTDRVLGQDEAVTAMMNAVLAVKARLCDDRRPIRSFLFVGPTGVGKTESAKVLAEFLFGSQDRLIRVNMSEYNMPGDVDKLLRSSRGGRIHESHLLSSIRKNPFSVVLLDEVEKADRKVLNLLLQLLDEGLLRDDAGKPANFQSSIIIMTSNIGARRYTAQTIGFGNHQEVDTVQSAVLDDVKRFFTPEIFNRFDEVICFKPLSKKVLSTIINREIGKVLERRGIVSREISVDVDPLVKEYIIETGYDPKYGARHLRRAVEKAVAIPLATLMSTTNVVRGSRIRINLVDGKPRACVVELEMRELVDAETAAVREIKLSRLEIPDRGLRKMLASMESRISSLKDHLGLEETLKRREELQRQMVGPTFWDNPYNANSVLKQFAEVNRKIERIRRWENVYEKIKSAVMGSSVAGKVPTRVKSQIIGLMKDLESAEMEILLEGRHDFADAFLILEAQGASREDISWLVDMTGVYLNWAKRRGYHARFVGEVPLTDTGGYRVILHIGGLNTYGLLRNEEGIHRKQVARQVGKRTQFKRYDCKVTVLADVHSAEEMGITIQRHIRNIKPPRRGHKMRVLSKRVSVSLPDKSVVLEFFSDKTVEIDRKLADDLFLAYLSHVRSERPAPRHAIWGSLVRMLEVGKSGRIIDYASNTVMRNVKDYLGGKIDSLLLERLT